LSGKNASVKIEPKYEGSSLRPKEFTVIYQISGEQPKMLKIPNSAGGV
jgi:filamentous hemagglutinin